MIFLFNIFNNFLKKFNKIYNLLQTLGIVKSQGKDVHKLDVHELGLNQVQSNPNVN